MGRYTTHAHTHALVPEERNNLVEIRFHFVTSVIGHDCVHSFSPFYLQSYQHSPGELQNKWEWGEKWHKMIPHQTQMDGMVNSRHGNRKTRVIILSDEEKKSGQVCSW